MQKPVGRHHHGGLRRALLDAVAEITQRAGPEAVKLRELARRIGVSHAALTPHFGDLRGLLTAFASEAFERLTQSMETEIAGAPDAPLRASGRGYIRFAMTNPGHFRTMFRTDHLDMSNPGLARAGEAAFGVLQRAMCAEYPELDGEALADIASPSLGRRSMATLCCALKAALATSFGAQMTGWLQQNRCWSFCRPRWRLVPPSDYTWRIGKCDETNIQATPSEEIR